MHFPPSDRVFAPTMQTLNVVASNTSNLTKDFTRKAIERKRTELTEITTGSNSLSKVNASSIKRSSLSRSSSAGQSTSLMRLLAKEMLTSINTMPHDEGDDCLYDGSNTDKHNLNIEAIADLFLKRLADHKRDNTNSDKVLRDMLRKGLALNENPVTADDEYKNDEEDCETFAHDETFSLYSSSNYGGTAISEMSMHTRKCMRATMDIFHPDFWNTGESELETTAHESATQSGTSGANKPLGANMDEMIQGTAQASSSIEAFINRHNGECPSEEEQSSSEDCSDISDISGTTEAFADDCETRLTKKSKESSIQSSGKASRRSSIGLSIEDSLVKSMQSCSDNDTINRVSFGQVTVRHYERIMCDNPATTTGPSIGIGWNYVTKHITDINDFERSRTRAPKRGSALVMNRPQREKIIRHLGYCDKDIAAVVRELNKRRFQRRQTVNNLGAFKMEEAVELAKRKVKHMLFLTRDRL